MDSEVRSAVLAATVPPKLSPLCQLFPLSPDSGHVLDRAYLPIWQMKKLRPVPSSLLPVVHSWEITGTGDRHKPASDTPHYALAQPQTSGRSRLVQKVILVTPLRAP